MARCREPSGCVGSDYETNLYAIRDGYDSAISFFLKRAVEDGVDRLTQVANQLSPKTDNRPLVLLGATLIDVTNKPSITDSAVVIDGDRIVAAGPRSAIKIPDGAKTIDVTGKFLLPGLWDMHSHFYQVEFGPTYLAAGITTARDVGNDIEFATAAEYVERAYACKTERPAVYQEREDGHAAAYYHDIDALLLPVESPHPLYRFLHATSLPWVIPIPIQPSGSLSSRNRVNTDTRA